MNMFRIKLIAVISMLIDHFGLFFYPDSFVLHVAGRLAFPLFAWLIANGARYTHDIDAYLRRLFIFAVISQIPYYFGYSLSGHFQWFFNVLFTLFFGLLAIRLIQMTPRKSLWLAATLVCAALACAFNTDYGATGVISIVAFYLCFDNVLSMAVSQALILGIAPLASYAVSLQYHLPIYRFYYADTFEIYGLLALVVIYLYNHKRGPRIQYFFYWFFPLQNIAILILSLVVPRGF